MLRESRLRTRRPTQTPNPMEGVANLADVMLVFCCGLMIAIILYWQVDMRARPKVLPQGELREVFNVIDADKGQSIADAYEERGTVYQDPETKKLYVVETEAGEEEK